MNAKIQIEGLWKIFRGVAGPVVALQNVNVVVGEGEFFCIVGPSGCGKTTLLRILAGLEKETSGRVTLRRAYSEQPPHSVVFQEQSIFPWMTVRDNIGYGLAMRGITGSKRRHRVDDYLERVGLTKFARSFPFELSGGMKQRVSLARAFANDPEVLLMDEPFAALDEQNKFLLQEELLKIWSETRKTVVFITHSIDEAVFLGDRIMVMTARPGRAKALVEVPFSRPRSIYSLRSDPKYGATTGEIWNVLRDEVMQAKQAEVGA